MKIKAMRTKLFAVILVSVLLILFMLNGLFINLMRNNREIHIENYQIYLHETTKMRLNLYVDIVISEIEGFKMFIVEKAEERISAVVDIIERALTVDHLDYEELRALTMEIQQYNINQNIFFYNPEEKLYWRFHTDGGIEERQMAPVEFDAFLSNYSVRKMTTLEDHGIITGAFFNIEWFDEITKDMLVQLIENLTLEDEEFVLIDEILEDEEGRHFGRRIFPLGLQEEYSHISKRILDVDGNYPYSLLIEDIKRDGESYFSYFSYDYEEIFAYSKLYPQYNWIIIAGIRETKEAEALEKERAVLVQTFFDQVNTMLGVSAFAIILIVFLLFLLEKFFFGTFIQYTEGLESNVKEYESKISSLAENSQIDEVTSIYNRRYMEETLKRYFQEAKKFALILIDLDFFKRVNDTYGHDAGDYILHQVSWQIKGNLLMGDIITRYGGEEFLVIVDEKNRENIFQYADRLRKEVENAKYMYNDQEISITISLGVSYVRPQDQTYMDAFNRSDRNLYLSKENGRNRVTLDEG